MPCDAVTLAIPTLDEEAHIAGALATLLPQVERTGGEVFVVDGGSRDRTRQIVTEIGRDRPALRLLHNPRRLQAAALNMAAREAAPGTRILIRADAHAGYPDDFVERVVAAFDSGAQSVVVPMRASGEANCFQRAAAAAQNSLVGNGGARHRRAGASGFVDHGHHAGFDLATFRHLGGYDESFSHNEDAEYDLRLQRAGGRIFLAADAVVDYYPRASARALFRQYVNHGRGRARTILKHGVRPRLRQMLPPAAVAGSVAGVAMAPIHPAFLLLPVGYFCLVAAIGLVIAQRTADRCHLGIAPAALIMHTGWAFGFLGRLVRHLRAGTVTGPPASPKRKSKAL